MKFLDEDGVLDVLTRLFARSAVSGEVTFANGVSGEYSLKKSYSGTVVLTAELATTVNLSANMHIATLPEGFRPTENVYVSATSIWSDYNVSSVFLRIEPDGKIYASGYYSWGGAETAMLTSCYVNATFII
jgi:hypothetical protein